MHRTEETLFAPELGLLHQLLPLPNMRVTAMQLVTVKIDKDAVSSAS
jgi:hypothetical protein